MYVRFFATTANKRTKIEINSTLAVSISYFSIAAFVIFHLLMPQQNRWFIFIFYFVFLVCGVGMLPLSTKTITHTHTLHQILRKTCERCLSPSSFLPQSHYFCRGFSIGGNPILFCYSSNVYFIMHSLCKRVVCVLSSSSQKRHLSQHIQRGLQFVFC